MRELCALQLDSDAHGDSGTFVGSLLASRILA